MQKRYVSIFLTLFSFIFLWPGQGQGEVESRVFEIHCDVFQEKDSSDPALVHRYIGQLDTAEIGSWAHENIDPKGYGKPLHLYFKYQSDGGWVIVGLATGNGRTADMIKAEAGTREPDEVSVLLNIKGRVEFRAECEFN